MKMIRNLFSDANSLVLPMSDSLRRKNLLNFMIRILMGFTVFVWVFHLLSILVLGPSGDPGNDYVLFGVPIIFLGMAMVLVINHRTQGYWASLLLIAVVFVGSTLDDPAEVAEGRSLLYFSIPIVLSSLLLRSWAGFATAGLACIVNVIFVVTTPGTTVNGSAIAAYITLAGIMWIATSRLEKTVRHMDRSNLALRESEQRYRTLVETSPDIVVVSDMLGTIEIVNNAGVKILGYKTRSEILGKKTWDLIEPGSRLETKELFRKTFIVDAIKDSKMEVLVSRKDSSFATIELNNSLVIDEATGSPIKIIAVGRDITQRKIAEQQLIGEKSRLEETVRESEEAYETLVEYSHQGLALIQNRRVIKANQAFARMVGLTLPELYDIDTRKLEMLLHPDDIQVTMDQFRGYIQGERQQAYETRLLLKDGQTVWLEFNLSRIIHKEQPAFQLTVIDRTERKLAELNLERSVAQLKKLESSLREAKDALEIRVAERTAELNESREQLRKLTRKIVNSLEDERRRVSRELHDEAGQILIGLKYRLGEALSGLPPEYQAEREKIVIAMNSTDQAMQKLRTLAHMLRPPTLDVAGINLSLQSLCREFADQTSLAVYYKGVELPNVGDEISISLYRILQEALTNVAKHASDATRIDVTLRHKNEEVVLMIVDNGTGYQSTIDRKGIGLLGIQERLSLLGGRLEIALGERRRGVRLKAIIPLLIEFPSRTDK